MSEERWVLVEKTVEVFYQDVLKRLRARSTLERKTNIFLHAIAGRASNISKLERTIVTMLGDYAPRIFRIFFDDTKDLDPPFDFHGWLRDRELWVKVVSSGEAFNKVVREYVEHESYKYREPVILTLQGDYFDPVRVGRAIWYSPQTSWYIVAGEGSYKRFRDIVYKTASKYRDEIWSFLKEREE
jgi:hypothetical protein